MAPPPDLPRTHLAARGVLGALFVLVLVVLLLAAHRAGWLPHFFDRLGSTWHRATEWARS